VKKGINIQKVFSTNGSLPFLIALALLHHKNLLSLNCVVLINKLKKKKKKKKHTNLNEDNETTRKEEVEEVEDLMVFENNNKHNNLGLDEDLLARCFPKLVLHTVLVWDSVQRRRIVCE